MNPTYLLHQAQTLHNLGVLHSRQRRMEEARKECQGAQKIDRGRTQMDP
jgi:Tfp pilus assembly protein PilF